jgi:hypothetical protein
VINFRDIKNKNLFTFNETFEFKGKKVKFGRRKKLGLYFV